MMPKPENKSAIGVEGSTSLPDETQKPHRKVGWIFGLYLAGALLLAIYIYFVEPNLLVKHHHSAGPGVCITLLRQVEAAKAKWQLDNHKADTDTATLSDIAGYLRDGVIPKCPQGGTYSMGKTVADNPVCSIAGHSL